MKGSAMAKSFCLAVGVSLALCSIEAVAQEIKLPLTLTVEAGQRDRVDTPVTFKPALTDTRGVRLVELADAKEIRTSFQQDLRDRKRLWWIARNTTAAGSKRTYRLEKIDVPDVIGVRATAFIDVTDTDRTIEVRVTDKPLLRYNKAHVEPPEGVNPRYGRSAHIHPVWTPGGAIVTDELPPDHLHQSGIFLAFTKTQFEGRDVDFWNLAGGKGRVRFKERGNLTSGTVFGEFHVTNEHVDLTAGDDKSEIGKTGG